jgi:Flp pilus assembly secretin CpaC
MFETIWLTGLLFASQLWGAVVGPGLETLGAASPLQNSQPAENQVVTAMPSERAPQVHFEVFVAAVNRSRIGAPPRPLASAAVRTPFKVLANSKEVLSELQALREKGDASLYAEPRVLTLNGRSARVVSGGEVPILTPSPKGGTNVCYKTTGLEVFMLPTVLTNGKIHLEVRPEFTTMCPADNNTVAPANAVPSFKTQSCKVTVQIDDGQTLAIGGMTQTEQIEKPYRVPVLGWLPFIGGFFELKLCEPVEQDLVILVTPKLVVRWGVSEQPHRAEAAPKQGASPAATPIMLKTVIAEVDRSALPLLGLGKEPLVLNHDEAFKALNVLKEMGCAKSLAEPTIVGLDGQNATFQTGGSFPVPGILTNAGGSPQENAQYIPYGVQLTYTPTRTGKDRTRLDMSVKVSERDTLSSILQTDLPSLTTRNLASTFELRDGQTVAIGGLLQVKDLHSECCLPMLSQIPYLNRLLVCKGYREKELVILVSAEAVSPYDPPALVRLEPWEPTVAPSDTVFIQALKLVPKSPYYLDPMEVLTIDVPESFSKQKIKGNFMITPEGTINLGYNYDSVRVAGLTVAQAQRAICVHLSGILKNPTVNIALVQTRGMQNIQGEHLVRPDGTISLGLYGSVHVAGMPVSRVKCVVERRLADYLANPQILAEVFSYKSKNIYIIDDGDGYGRQVTTLPATGEETVLDVLSQYKQASSRKIWVSRPSKNECLPVDWTAITQNGHTATNYQLFAGDRVYLKEPTSPPTDHAEESSPPEPRRQMLVDDVVRLSQRGIAEDIIIRQMRLTGANFDLTVDQILTLNERGVSDNIIRAMQQRRTNAK